MHAEGDIVIMYCYIIVSHFVVEEVDVQEPAICISIFRVQLYVIAIVVDRLLKSLLFYSFN